MRATGRWFDKVCLLMNFFQHLKPRKSQANALMNQLARQWEEEFDLLCLLLAKQLFTFVTAEPVEKPNGETLAVLGTNNEAERTLRSPAQARDTGRTNKTAAGARRQTVIVSVLESLRQHLSTFTLSSVIEEIQRWSETGRSCFARWAEKLGLTGHGLPDDGCPSLLDRVIPVPDG